MHSHLGAGRGARLFRHENPLSSASGVELSHLYQQERSQSLADPGLLIQSLVRPRGITAMNAGLPWTVLGRLS
jgi:hypothetical protein